MFFPPQSIAIAMVVGSKASQCSATQGELDQQDNESCDSLVLTVSDGSVHVKSEPCSENEGPGPKGNSNDPFELGLQAAGNSPDFEAELTGRSPGSSKPHTGLAQAPTDKLFAVSPLSNSRPLKESESVPESKRWATLDQGGRL